MRVSCRPKQFVIGRVGDEEYLEDVRVRISPANAAATVRALHEFGFTSPPVATAPVIGLESLRQTKRQPVARAE